MYRHARYNSHHRVCLARLKLGYLIPERNCANPMAHFLHGIHVGKGAATLALMHWFDRVSIRLCPVQYKLQAWYLFPAQPLRGANQIPMATWPCSYHQTQKPMKKKKNLQSLSVKSFVIQYEREAQTLKGGIDAITNIDCGSGGCPSRRCTRRCTGAPPCID